MSQDKRQHDRYAVSLELEGKTLNALESARIGRASASQRPDPLPRRSTVRLPTSAREACAC
jgi:hypothetical protein